MSFIIASKKTLEDEMSKLLLEEVKIDTELSQYFGMLRKTRTSTSKAATALDTLDLSSSLLKIEQSGPTFEAMLQDSKKMANQIEEGRLLSDRLSGLVRRLDVMQIRSQQAMACTEDIMNMKDCKTKLCAALEDRNLSLAVSLVRQVHEIDVKAAKTSDDFEIIVKKEMELKEMVREEFNTAISNSDIDRVMALCPLLQTLGLESEARDSFLEFVGKTIFINISADVASHIEGTVDNVTGYAQELSGIFNQAFTYIQKYLPMVIAGMESSQGDVYFIRQLHTRVEEQAGILLKRYMKYRHVKDMAQFCKTNAAVGENKQILTTADIHCAMDELGLLIQYCSRYSDFLKHVCNGAESKVRRGGLVESGGSNHKVVVFTGPTGFDRMKEEMISKYYLVGENWLMENGVRNALQRSSVVHGTGNRLDECFFILQKCALRAIATNDVDAACAVLNSITNMVSSDLLTQGTEILLTAANRVGVVLQDHMSLYRRSVLNSSSGAADSKMGVPNPASLSTGFQNAMSLATSMGGGVSVVGRDSVGSGANGAAKDDIQFHESGGFWFASSSGDDDDVWGVAGSLDAFNVIELCARYTERLGKDVWTAGQSVFTSELRPEQPAGDNKAMGNSRKVQTLASMAGPSGRSPHERLRLCREDFEACGAAFYNGAERLSIAAQPLMKEIFTSTFGRTGPFGGVRFDEADHLFDSQPALNLLPKVLTLPFETILNISTFRLSEKTKDLIVGLLVVVCCEKCEQFVTQNNFRFAGALKLEEIVRSLSALFGRHSSAPVRGKFSRLREVMQVLTADLSACTGGIVDAVKSVASESFTQLTASDVESIMSLRADLNDKK